MNNIYLTFSDGVTNIGFKGELPSILELGNNFQVF